MFLWERWTQSFTYICIFEKLVHAGYQDSFPLLTGTEELKERFDREGQNFLDCIITCDEIWVHHITPESKRASKQWKHANSRPPKNFEQLLLQVKWWKVFFDTHVALFMWIFYPVVPLSTVNITVVFCVMCTCICGKKRPGFITKAVLFLHTAHRTTCTLQQLGWEVLPRPPYSPDLTSSDSHLFGPLKEFLGGQHFSTNDEVKQAVLGWFSHTDTSFYAEAFQALVKRWDKCINVSGECVKK